jgi:hypothetical protein
MTSMAVDDLDVDELGRSITLITVHPWLEHYGVTNARRVRGIWRARRLALLLLRRALAVVRRPDVRFGLAAGVGPGVSASVRDAVPARMTTGPPALLASGASHVT